MRSQAQRSQLLPQSPLLTALGLGAARCRRTRSSRRHRHAAWRAREGLEHLYAVNTTAPFFITQQVLPRLRDGGRIISVGTMLTRGAAMPQAIGYAMSKAALDVLTTALAKQLGPRGITVNLVAPGVVDTDMHQGRLVGQALEWLVSQTPLGRLGTPQDIADAVAFLASDDSRYITGHRLDVSGGTTM
ncbi:SDR family oxidoreductase [Nonomuraea sp. B1E8]|uniref:SDR family NAD(P)-dependent oxidoreductase n=1 Tax=unclassified Nonomuraea TaxID=2593643 RepID=UPI00325D4D0C